MSPASLIGEQAKLCLQVLLGAGVPVEVVFGEVEEHAGLGRKGLAVLELEARRLAHDGGVGRQLAGVARHGRADVAGDRDR